MKRTIIALLLLAAVSASAQLRISEICPQPATKHPTTQEVIDQLDPNGKVSGWIELENISATDSVDLANYQIVRTHRGKKVKDKPYSVENPTNEGTSKLPSRQIGPGERVLIYTSDEYDNDEEVDGIGLTAHYTDNILHAHLQSGNILWNNSQMHLQGRVDCTLAWGGTFAPDSLTGTLRLSDVRYSLSGYNL